MPRSSLAARLTSLAVLVLAATALAVPALAARALVPPTPVTVTAGAGTEFHFKLSRASAPHGRIAFKLVNHGKLAHDFKIAGHKTALVAPGASTKLTLRLAKGAYPYKCTVAGHAAAGMKGTFRVT